MGFTTNERNFEIMKSLNEKFGISREEAVKLLNKHIKNPNMRKHCYAAEAVMRALAERLDRNKEEWALAGLLHDLDIEIVQGDLSVHGLKTAEILVEKGVAPEIIDVIKLHNEKAHGNKRNTLFQHALAAGETITGLIVATALVYPDKKLNRVKTNSVVKRMKEKAFARSVDRDIILECEEVGIPLNEFCELALNAMQDVADVLEL